MFGGRFQPKLILVYILKVILMIVRSLFSNLFRQSSYVLNNNLIIELTMNVSLQYTQRALFCDTTKANEDELTTYEQYLLKFNQSIRKPHEKMRSQEQRIIQKYLNQRQYAQIIAFINRNSNNTLGDANTACKIDDEIALNWQKLNSNDQISAAFSLIKLRQTKTFDKFKQPIQKRIKNDGIQSIESQQLIIYLCGELINRKSLRFISKLHPKVQDRKQIYQKIYKYIDQRQYRGTYSKQRRLLLQYIGLMLDPTLNKREDSIPDRERSPLEVTIQSFLSVLGVQYERQIKINGFYIDYLVKARKDDKTKEFILEVNGNYHYTLNGKLKGRQIIRNLIINEYAPLRIIHHHDFLISKGHRNKMAYLDSLFSEKMINWETTKRGKDSRWEVKIDQETLREK